MNKTKKILIITSVVLAVVVIFLLVLNKNKSAPTKNSVPAPSNQLPTGTPTSFKMPAANDQKITVTTPQGNTIETNNVYKNSLYPLSQNGVAFHDDLDYYAAFYPQDQGFLIVIHNPDVKAAKIKAEADFLQILGITKEQACMLKVSVTIPRSVSEQLSGKVYGLSFCPGVITF